VQPRIGIADDSDRCDPVQRHQARFDFRRRHVLAAYLEHVLIATEKNKAAILAFLRHIAG
jgi:hypothetical protein